MTLEQTVDELILSWGGNITNLVDKEVRCGIIDALRSMNIETIEELKQLSVDSIRRMLGSIRSGRAFDTTARIIVKLHQEQTYFLKEIDNRYIYVKDSGTRAIIDINGERILREFDRLRPAQVSLLSDIINATPMARVDRPTFRSLCNVILHSIKDHRSFIAMDITDIKRACGRSHGARKVLTLVRAKPLFDPRGQFSTHLFTVPITLMNAHSILWLYPVDVASSLYRHIPNEADRTHMLNFLETLTLSRIAAHPEREEMRTRQATAQYFHTTLVVSLANIRGKKSFQEVFPEKMTLETLLDVVSKVQGNTYWRIAQKNRTENCDDVVDGISRTVSYFNGAIRLGIFENSGISSRERINIMVVRRNLLELEKENPDLYRYKNPRRKVVEKPTLQEDDAQKLLQAAKKCSFKDLSVLLLLYTVALRGGAIERMKKSDVWDDNQSCIRRICQVTEKFSRIHKFVPCPQLREALHNYITKEWSPDFLYLFSNPRNPQRIPRSMSAAVVNRISKAAQVGPFHPHQFRALMVSLFVKYTGSNGLEKGAKFLGHKNPTVTYRRYWKPNAEELIAKIPFFSMPSTPPCSMNDTKTSMGSIQTLYAWEHNKRKQLQEEIAVYMQLLPTEKLQEAERLISVIRRRYETQSIDDHSVGDEEENVSDKNENEDIEEEDFSETSDADDPLASFRRTI